MANEKELSVLSLYVYEADPRNTPLLPTGWFEITPRTAGTSGFAYAVFQGPGGEVVISYRGTDNFWSGDMLTNIGATAAQEKQAAAIAAHYINQGLNVTFTGHSLGKAARLKFEDVAGTFGTKILRKAVNSANYKWAA